MAIQPYGTPTPRQLAHSSTCRRAHTEEASPTHQVFTSRCSPDILAIAVCSVTPSRTDQKVGCSNECTRGAWVCMNHPLVLGLGLSVPSYYIADARSSRLRGFDEYLRFAPRAPSYAFALFSLHSAQLSRYSMPPNYRLGFRRRFHFGLACIYCTYCVSDDGA
jgi:hypothetical protein